MARFRFRSRFGLSTKIGSLFILATSVPLLLLALGLIYNARESMRKYVYQRDSAVAEIASDFVGQYRINAERLIEDLAGREELRRAVANHDDRAMGGILGRAQDKHPEFDTFFVVLSSDHTQHFSRENRSELGSLFANRGYVEKTTTSGQVFVSEAFRTSTSTPPVVGIASPTRASDGQVTGVLVGALSLYEFGRSLSAIKSAEAGWVTVVDQTGTVIVDSDETKIMNSIAGQDAAIKQVMAGKSGQMEQISEQGIKSLATFRPAKGTGWGIVVQVPVDDAYSEVEKIVGWSVAWFVISLAIAFFLATLVSRRISGPLRRLSLAVAEAGHGNLEGRVQLRTGDEIEELADNYNLMAEQLRQKVQELAHALARAEAERARAKTITAVSADGIMVVDDQERIIEVNPAFERLTGYYARELIGENCPSFLDKRDHDGLSICEQDCPFANARSHIHTPIEATIRTRKGERIWVAVTLGLMRDEEGKIRGVVHNIRDMSWQKEVQRLKDEFMGIISHELRTPLTAILGYLDMLLKSMQGPLTAKQERTLNAMRANALRLLSLINDLLDVSRLEAEEVALSRKNMDISDAVEKALSSVAILASTKGLTLRQNLPDRLPHVLADEDKFQQILYNLLSNAVKFTPEGGIITVEAETGSKPSAGDPVVRFQSNGSHVVQFRVVDTGVGIMRDKLPHIWDRFYQVDSSPSRRYAGTGLGLAIVKNLVELHGGQVWAESAGVGQGSTFGFTLPVSTENNQPLPEHLRSSEIPASPG